MDAVGIYCDTEVMGRVTLPEVNKNHDNVDTENPMCWEIELNPPHGVVSVETNGPKEKFELLDHEIRESLHSSGQTYHEV